MGRQTGPACPRTGGPVRRVTPTGRPSVQLPCPKTASRPVPSSQYRRRRVAPGSCQKGPPSGRGPVRARTLRVAAARPPQTAALPPRSAARRLPGYRARLSPPRGERPAGRSTARYRGPIRKRSFRVSRISRGSNVMRPRCLHALNRARRGRPDSRGTRKSMRGYTGDRHSGSPSFVLNLAIGAWRDAYLRDLRQLLERGLLGEN